MCSCARRKVFFSHVSFYRIMAFYWFLLYTHKMENLSCAQQIARAWFWPTFETNSQLWVHWCRVDKSIFHSICILTNSRGGCERIPSASLFNNTSNCNTLPSQTVHTYMYFRKVTEEQLALSLYSEEATTPRYVLTIVDSDIKSNNAFAIFIVPQGRYSHFTCFPSISLPFLVNILCEYLLFLYLLLKELEEKEVWQYCLHL